MLWQRGGRLFYAELHSHPLNLNESMIFGLLLLLGNLHYVGEKAV